MARTHLCEESEFDPDYHVLLTGLVEEFGWDYPPQDIEAAHELYRDLRAEARVALDWP